MTEQRERDLIMQITWLRAELNRLREKYSRPELDKLIQEG
jgi:hypothetical protein